MCVCVGGGGISVYTCVFMSVFVHVWHVVSMGGSLTGVGGKEGVSMQSIDLQAQDRGT